MAKSILVTGATGKQGGAVISALLASTTPWTILAVTRDANSSSAQKLAAKSSEIKLVEGDMNDVPGLFAAAQKQSPSIWGVYSVQVSQGKGVTHEGEISQGKAMVDSALSAGVSHFVYSSVERGGDDKSWDTETPIPHFSSKYLIERYLRDVAGDKMGWTILRPVAFMDNWAPGFPARVFMTALANNGMQTKKLQWVATSDIGVFAAKAFEKPQEWNGKAIGLAGDDLNVPEVSAAFEKGAGASVTPTFGFLGSVLTTLVSEMGIMVKWFGTDGYGADLQKCKSLHPGMKTFEEWVRTESPFKN